MEIEQENQYERNPSDQERGPGQSSSSVRSYQCTFCRRGFSNAQALGGHMNIHRRDKAKLKHKHLSSSSSSSLSSPTNEPQQSLPSPVREGITNPSIEAKFSEDRSSMIRWPWILDYKRNHTYVSQNTQLLLFDDKPRKEQQQLSNRIHGNSRTDEKDLYLSSHVLTSSSELDLELRLGPPNKRFF